MKAFLLSLAALVVITIGSNLILKQVGFTSEAASTSEANVRVSD